MVIIRGKALAGPILFFAGLAILATLGGWQLLRGLEKSAIERRMMTDSEGHDVDRAPGDWASLDYRRAQLTGRWIADRTFLLENRIYRGEPGFEVLTPFRLSADGAVMLVNRGWIARAVVENGVPPPLSNQAPAGVMYRPQKGFTLGDTLSGPLVWPQTVLYLDLPALSRRLDEPVAPAMLVLEQAHPDSLQTLWQPTSIPASRHYGYAVQWWGLGLTLLVFGVIWHRRSKSRINQ